MNLKLFITGFRDKFFLFSMFFIFIVSAQAQKKVSGTVLSDKSPLPGASVIVKGTTVSASTDFDGRFQLSVPSDAKILVVSYLGFATEEFAITGEEMKISLLEESKKLDEVVVNVGYGTQKKSVVTGAISKVTAKDLERIPSGGIGQALQGRTSGVTVAANSGQPGALSTIKIRGIATFNRDGSDEGSSPLYLVDGVVVDGNAMNFLNQSDIESLEVLKDASAVIYGTQASKGVILITTKKGKAGKITVNYNGYTGVSSPSKVLKLLNASEYGALMNEKYLAGGATNVPYPNLGALGTGTDWQKAIFNNNAIRYNHELSLSGGSENSNFYLSFGLQDTQGIVASEISNFTKKSIRLNSNHKISKVFSFGETVGYTHEKALGIGNTNSEFGGPLSSAINLDPITPLVVTDPVVANGAPYAGNPVIRDEFGNPYGISKLVANEMTNPLAYIKTRLGNFNWSDNFVGSAFLQANITNALKFKTQLGAKLAYWGNEGFTPVYFLNANNSTINNNYTRQNNNVLNTTIENTLTYTKAIGNHNFTVLLGQSVVSDGNGGGTSVTLSKLPITNYQDASFLFDIPASDRTGGAWDFKPHRISSLFSRLNYTYKDKYLFTGIIRRDGSTNFGTNFKYGVFPSVSLGWVVSKENFWKEDGLVNYFKIRGSYGKSGNDNAAPFTYLSRVGGGYNYYLGGILASGYAPETVANPDLHWEETIQANVGFETRIAKNFNMTFDVYNKEVSGILQRVYIPLYVGVTGRPTKNIADMSNKGAELELGYKKTFGNLNFSATGNVNYLKNEVTYLGQDIKFITEETAGFQSMGAITRTQVGESYNSFYGYQTAGIFQNQSEINAYATSTGLIQPNAKPGDFRWVDANGDGKINDDDKTFLGSPLPKYTYGLTLNFDYKGFDLMVFTQGVAGNKIFQGLRRTDIGDGGNYQTVALSRWTGEGTSNTYPRLTTNDTNGNFTKMSDFYLQKGDYFRLKVLQLGYSLPESLLKRIYAQKIRLYVSGENLYTFTKYTGYDPEIGGSTMGVDRGYYPQARTIMFGANLQF